MTTTDTALRLTIDQANARPWISYEEFRRLLPPTRLHIELAPHWTRDETWQRWVNQAG